MARQYSHLKQFLEFRGVDLRSSEILRPAGFSPGDVANVVHTAQGGITQRWGSHIIAGNYGRYGLFYFKTTDLTGVEKEELVGIGRSSGTDSKRAWRLVRSSFTITNANGTSRFISHYYDSALGYFRLLITLASGNSALDMNLGLGTEGSPVMLSSVETAVDAVTGLSMSTPTGASSAPAAFMEQLNAQTIAASGGSITIYYWYWEVIPQGLASSSETEFSQQDNASSESYRNVSAALVSGDLYLANPGSTSVPKYLLKYDGNRIFRAGLPLWETIQVTSTGSASRASPYSTTADPRGQASLTGVTITTPWYRFSFINVDKAGNRFESPLSIAIETPTGATTINTIPGFSQVSGSGHYTAAFNKAYAKVNGSQSGVLTITVTAGHTMQAGDVAYFWDSNQSRFIQRVVTATTSTSITISTTSLDSDPTSRTYDAGGNVNVLNPALITNNARVAQYRATSEEGPYYLVEEWPDFLMISALTTYMFMDNMSDGALASQPLYLEPNYPHDPPPQNCGMVAEYNGGLILAGNPLKPNTVYFNDIDGAEYFPSVTHNFDLPTAIKGFRQSGEFLALGTANSLHLTSGVLSDFQFRVDQVGSNIGVTSHHSMVEFEEGVLAFSSNVGPYMLVGGRQLTPLGAAPITQPGQRPVSRLEPYWTQRYAPTASKPVFERAVAAVLPNEKLYVLFVPVESPSSPAVGTSSSVTWVYDYGRDVWWKWTGLTMAGGIAVLGNTLYWTSRASSSTYLYQLQMSPAVGVYNYADHGTATTWTWRGHWEALGQPRQFKRFLRVALLSQETRQASTTTVDLNTYIDYSTATQVGDDTLSWTTETSLTPKLKGSKCYSQMIELTSSAFYQPFVLSGLEIEAVSAFREEMKPK